MSNVQEREITVRLVPPRPRVAVAVIRAVYQLTEGGVDRRGTTPTFVGDVPGRADQVAVVVLPMDRDLTPLAGCWPCRQALDSEGCYNSFAPFLAVVNFTLISR